MDVVWSCTAASTDHVDQAIHAELFGVRGEVLWALIITTHSVGETCIWISVDIHMSKACESLQEWVHLSGTQSAIETNTERFGIHHGNEESLSILS